MDVLDKLIYLARLALLLGRLAAMLAVSRSSNWEGGQKGDGG